MRLKAVGRWLFEKLAGEFLALANKVVVQWIRLISVGYAEILKVREQGRPMIFVGWHGHNFINIGVYLRMFGQDSRAVIMVRNNLGGRILAHFAHRRKISVVFLGKDPNSFRWAKGVAKVINLVKNGGYDALIAVDGPEGPAYQVRPGAALMAKRSGAMLVPMVATSNRSMNLVKRWDKHMIPLPGARTVVHFGPIIDPLEQHSLPPTLDELQEKIAEALLTGIHQADGKADSTYG
jgi:lysophospholipid acyltransferase (LPLAT)-like uncharacterized protein